MVLCEPIPHDISYGVVVAGGEGEAGRIESIVFLPRVGD